MAKIRSIHPDTCESRTLASLSAHAERTFWRLLPHTDDYGRGKFDPIVLRNKLYMASPDVDVAQVEYDLRELCAAGLLTVYRNGGRDYYHVTSWDEYQKPKHKSETKIPDPDGEGSTPIDPDPDPIDPQPSPDLPHGGLVEGEGESSLSDPSPAGAGVGGQAAESGADDAADDGAPTAEDTFEEFWKVYPARNGEKRGKANALIEWRKLTLDQRRRAYVGAKNLAATDTLPKDAERFLRRAKGGKGDFPFDDYQQSPKGSRPPRDPNACPDCGYTPDKHDDQLCAVVKAG